MILELPTALVIAAVGMTVFHRFAEGHSYWRRVFKWAFYFGVTILLSTTLGRTAAFVWVLAFRLWVGYSIPCGAESMASIPSQPSRERSFTS